MVGSKVGSYPQPKFSTITPGVVVAARQHPRRVDRYVVTVAAEDGTQGSFTVSDEWMARAGLSDGTELDTAAAAKLGDAAMRCFAYDRAIAALAARPRSRRELELWLMRRGVPTSHVASTIKRVTALGLLNDAQFAREFVRTRVAGRGASRWALRRDLARKGIARDTADAAIAEIMVDAAVDELALARREAEKKARTLQHVDPVVRRRRIMAFLQRRGFTRATVSAAIEGLL